MRKLISKESRLEEALYNWLDTTDDIQEDILNLIDKKIVSKSRIAKDIDKMKTRLVTLENNLRRY